MTNLPRGPTNFIKNCNDILAENCKTPNRKTLISNPFNKQTNKKDILSKNTSSQIDKIRMLLDVKKTT
jgi:hypothetical protein